MKKRLLECGVLIFTKEPKVGDVKTRIQPLLGPDRTLALHVAMVKYQVLQIRQVDFARLELWVAGNPQHPLFEELCEKDEIYQQTGIDLGQRMFNGAVNALQRGGPIFIVGTDCPGIDREYLSGALKLLKKGVDVVLGPALDGGYVLIGLNKIHKDIFDGIAWGSDQVLTQTIDKLNSKRVKFKLLAPRLDIDRPEDLATLSVSHPELIY